jgi:RNA polymerase primary sigma factor
MAKGGKIKEVEQLINMEGEKGFLTFDETNDIPSNDIVSSDQIDDVLMMFDEMDIDVVDDLQGLKVEEEKATEKEEEGDELEVETFGRATDPVRMYLREMGSVSLLTREGEVEIAKRIESGKREILSVVLNCPMAVKEVINLGSMIKSGKVEIREITNEIDEEETSVEEEQIQKKQILDLIEKIKRKDEDLRGLLKGKPLPRQKARKQGKKKQKETKRRQKGMKRRQE